MRCTNDCCRNRLCTYSTRRQRQPSLHVWRFRIPPDYRNALRTVLDPSDFYSHGLQLWHRLPTLPSQLPLSKTLCSLRAASGTIAGSTYFVAGHARQLLVTEQPWAWACPASPGREPSLVTTTKTGLGLSFQSPSLIRRNWYQLAVYQMPMPIRRLN